MTGSTRPSSITRSVVRAPYSAPQTTAPSLAPSRNFDPETGASLRLPAPFVPREFRAAASADVTDVPGVEYSDASNVGVLEDTTNAAPIALRFNDDIEQAPDFTTFIASQSVQQPEIPSVDHESGISESTSAQDLPWIDAFAADVPDEEERWPLGEAGKRLDELTQSLSSLDASRERLQAAERSNADAAANAGAALPMWNEDEWIDIMPTLSSDQPQQGNLEHDAPLGSMPGPVQDVRDSAAAHFASAHSAMSVNVETAARALEGLAERVRAGEVRVPAFPSELGQEAMLAGLLASMLGWRQ